MQVNPAPAPYYREVFLKDQMLYRLLASAKVHSRLLYVQQNRLHLGTR